jgi:NTE family protein
VTTSERPRRKVGLVLSGGGARGAYQAGVLRAIAEIRKSSPECQPIKVITGVSAGAINAAYAASYADADYEASIKLTEFWKNLTSERVYRSDALSLAQIAMKWIWDTILGSFKTRTKARSLLDTRPLYELLKSNIKFDRIQKMLDEGYLDAFAVSALNYATAHSISFVQAREKIEMWYRARRKGEFASISAAHVMASAALPLFFPSVGVDGQWYGDGSLRNTAPLSPAIHLGAGKLIVISVRRPEDKAVYVKNQDEPSIARVLGVMLNALLMDAIDYDMERLTRINSTLEHVPIGTRTELNLRKVEHLWIRPSEDIGFLASGQFKKLPGVMRYLMSGLGSSKESSELTSYLLFDPEYCGKLVDLGYRDGMAMQDEIRQFLS